MNGAFLVVVLIAVLALASAWRSAGEVRRWREAHRSESMAHRRTKIILRMEEDRADAYLYETLRLREQVDNPLIYMGIDHAVERGGVMYMIEQKTDATRPRK